MHWVVLDLVVLQAELELAGLLVFFCEKDALDDVVFLNELVDQFQVGLVAVLVHHANRLEEAQVLGVELAVGVQGAQTQAARLCAQTHAARLLRN